MENEQQTSQDLSVKDIEREMKKLELERARQALESQKIQDELNRLMLEEKRGAEDAKKAIEDLRAQQARCNHRTGGQGAEAILLGQGDAKRPTCIGAQVFLDERIRLVCGRCRPNALADEYLSNKWAYWVGL